MMWSFDVFSNSNNDVIPGYEEWNEIKKYTYINQQCVIKTPHTPVKCLRNSHKSPIGGTVRLIFWSPVKRRREIIFALFNFLFTTHLLAQTRKYLKEINMPLLLRTIASRAAPVLRGHTVCQRANVYSKPAKDTIGPVVSVLLVLKHLGLMLAGWLAS